VNLKERAMAGVFGGIAATLVLSGLREALTRLGLVFETAPMQVVNRMQEVGLVDGSSSEERRGLTVAAHFAYGMGTGTAFGFLRRERGGPTEEAAVGAALGLLAWGVGWASWLPLLGVHRAPWTERTPKVCSLCWTTQCLGPHGGWRTGRSVYARGATKRGQA
jgi:hypothetical protein